MSALRFLGLLCAGLFSGAALYINVVEHPARMAVGAALAHRQWAPSYRRATWLQAPLALLGGLASVGAGLLGGGTTWTVAGLLLVSVVPITLLVIRPTNSALLRIAPGEADERTIALLDRWARLHAVRTALSLAAFVLLVVELT